MKPDELQGPFVTKDETKILVLNMIGLAVSEIECSENEWNTTELALLAEQYGARFGVDHKTVLDYINRPLVDLICDD